MKINGNLEVLGESKIRVKEIEDYQFNSDDSGLLYTKYGQLFLNTGTKVSQIETTNRLNTLKSSLGNWLLNDFSFNPLTFNNTFDNVSGLDANSSLLDVLSQLDSAISNTYIETFTSPSNTYLVKHKLDADIAHVVAKNISTNIKLKDSDLTITYLSKDSLEINLSQSQPIKVLVSTI
jgi:hypothetical protein